MKFSSYHPVINLIYFAAALTGIILFRHPVFLAISFAAAFAWSVKLRGKRGLIFDLCLVPLILLYAGVYASYNHFGVTDLATDFIGNEITLESIVYGLVLGTMAAAFLMMFSCFLAVFSVDKIVYLFWKDLSEAFSHVVGGIADVRPGASAGVSDRNGPAGIGEKRASRKPLAANENRCTGVVDPDHLDAGKFY